MNIPQLKLEIKNVAEDAVHEWGTIAIVLLLGIASFGLGRLSALEEAKPPVAITEAPEALKPRAMYLGGSIIASKNGTAYYFPWCSGAQKILVQNQIWFASEKAARAAGYAPAKNCKGLGQPAA